MGMGLEDEEDRSEGGRGSTRSLTLKKSNKRREGKGSRKGSTNTDIFTLFPRSDQNPYDDVIAGPNNDKKHSQSAKVDKD